MVHVGLPASLNMTGRHPGRRAWPITGAAVVGCAALVVAGSNVLVMPAAIVGLLAALGALRRLRHHLDAASQRLGGALVVSGLSVLPNAAAGDVVLAGSSLVASVAFWTAWTRCQTLRRERRVEWGIRQRLILDRSAELHRRRAVLQSGAAPAESALDNEPPT